MLGREEKKTGLAELTGLNPPVLILEIGRSTLDTVDCWRPPVTKGGNCQQMVDLASSKATDLALGCL